jgi:folate-dependent phosphoribosylglycinamide formyltransferase PurN
MRTAFLASKALGIRLLGSVNLDGALILHPDDRGDSRSVWPEFEKIGARMVCNRAEADADLRDFRPDIVFVCGWYWLIAGDVLALAEHGFYGIHNSLLPKYRSGAPLVWAIINGEEEVGSTLFRLAGGIDDGPIAEQIRINLPRTATIADAANEIERRWQIAFPTVWRALCDGTLALRPQEGEPTLFPNRKPDDGLIDWSWPAARIHDFIRAQSAPYPGAFSSGTVFDHSYEAEQIGTPVLCGDGKLLHVITRPRHQLVA